MPNASVHKPTTYSCIALGILVLSHSWRIYRIGLESKKSLKQKVLISKYFTATVPACKRTEIYCITKLSLRPLNIRWWPCGELIVLTWMQTQPGNRNSRVYTVLPGKFRTVLTLQWKGHKALLKLQHCTILPSGNELRCIPEWNVTPHISPNGRNAKWSLCARQRPCCKPGRTPEQDLFKLKASPLSQRKSQTPHILQGPGTELLFCQAGAWLRQGPIARRYIVRRRSYPVSVHEC